MGNDAPGASANGQQGVPWRAPDYSDDVAVFSGDAYDNEMGIIAVLIGL